MASLDPPLTSCLMVTLPDPRRFEGLRHSLADYLRQSHPRAELVLVVNGGTAGARAAIMGYASSLGRDDIRIIEPQGELTLGELRNLSREQARGEFLCQWDDDDRHHPTRIERQLATLAGAEGEASYLQEIMQFFPASGTLYWTNWAATEAQGHPGTLLCRKSAPILYPEAGAEARLGEDLAVSRQLQQRGGVRLLAGAPHLYVYVSHGANVWAGDHHRMLARELAISQGLLRRREAALREGLAPYDFGPGAVTVQGSNGPAFTLEA